MLWSFTKTPTDHDNPTNNPVVDLLVKETEPFTALAFTTRATLPTLSQYYGTIAPDLYREADRLNLDVTEPIQWIYTGVNGDQENEFQLEIVLPIRQPGDVPNEFSYREFGAFRCASCIHAGSWEELGSVYDALFAQFYRDGYQNDGRIREVYPVIDVENPANCVTEIQVGIV